MTVRDELEADLRTRWDRETLAVYADHLESLGEPRGELISVDLRIDEQGATPELLAHRKALILQWFGFDPPGVRHGFVDIDATSADPVTQLTLLDGPASPFVRSVTIVGAPVTIERALVKLVEVKRPWLIHLTIRQWAETPTPSVTAEILARLVTNAPHLATLEIDGRRVFTDLAHGALRRMRISGFDAVATLSNAGLPLAKLAELDFAFICHLANSHESPSKTRMRSLLGPGRFPALVHLDLSRNEPGRLDPKNLGGEVDVFEFLAQLELRKQLTTLRLPAARTTAHVGWLRVALAEMPALRTLTIAPHATTDAAIRALEHSTATIVIADS